MPTGPRSCRFSMRPMGRIRPRSGGSTGGSSSCPARSCGDSAAGANGSSRITCSRSVRIVTTMQGRSLQWFAALVAAWVSAQAAAAVTDADRQQVYKQFRTAFDARQYAEALPLAEKVVSLTEEQYGSSDRKLANP